MFSHSTGAHVFGSNLCNAGGDIILQSSDLQIHGPYATFGQPALSASTLENKIAAGICPRLAFQRHESQVAASQFPADATSEFRPGQGSGREGGGVVRIVRRAIAERPAPYDAAPHSVRRLLNGEEFRGPRSSSSNTLIRSQGGLTRPVQAPLLRYPSSEFPLPQSHRNTTFDLHSLHPFTDPRPDVGLHQNCGTMHVPYPELEPAGAAPTHAMGRVETPNEERLLSYLHPCQLRPAQFFHGSNFLSAQNIINGQHINNYGDRGIHILDRAVAREALFDSADSFPQPQCHPETRTDMLDDLYNWAIQEEAARPIRWLHGPAGAGKSAIMQTLCQRLHSTGNLGGAFFFKREHPTRGNARVLFATLAYQLALNVGQLKPLISQSVESDPSIVARQMRVQLGKLIVEPSQALRDSTTLIFLVDGLDECDTLDAQAEVLRSICTAIHRHPTKFRFLVASRPEAHIRDVFEDASFDGILHLQNVEQSFDDIRTYFLDEFSRIHREHRHTMSGIPTPWPSPQIVKVLVEKSSGYFMYASTVIKFVDDKDSRPTERLAAVQNLSSIDSDTPFAHFDQLYIQILSGVPARFRSRLRDIFVVLLELNSCIESELTTAHLDLIFEMQRGDAELIIFWKIQPAHPSFIRRTKIGRMSVGESSRSSLVTINGLKATLSHGTSKENI
ncbi:hypothetical protein DFH06DRAFT_283251 [Mycena polygramma]|nr:hypothetical protein DFH06DRAFT_283251 [Mycena polygramma]